MKTILIIENNTDIRDNLINHLEIEGYRVLAANDGRKGVELARVFTPDLIICDILMLKMNGDYVLNSILKMRVAHQIPFILSGPASKKMEAINLGADNYTTQPYEVKLLLILIKNWLQTGKKNIKIELSFEMT
jgi:DNA-binding response OmpR family regulator